jgi:hypothetical protein
MSIESPDPVPRRQRQRGGAWRGFLRRFGLGAVEPSDQREENRSVSGNGNGDNGGGDVEQVDAGPITVEKVLADLERQKEAEVPAGLPTPYPLGNQVYPGTALWRGINTPEQAAAVGRALSKLDPPHVLAERDKM